MTRRQDRLDVGAGVGGDRADDDVLLRGEKEGHRVALGDEAQGGTELWALRLVAHPTGSGIRLSFSGRTAVAMRSLALVPIIESPFPLPPLRNIPAVVPMIVSDALPPQMALTLVAS